MAIQKRNDELVNVLEADFARSAMPFMMHNGVGGFYENAFSIADDTTITVLGAANPYRVTDNLYYTVVPPYSADNVAEHTGTVVLDDSAELFNDGDTICEIRVTAAGAIEVQRTAGTATLNIKLRLDWV